MAITDELRKYASGCAGGMGGDALRHIADRIDEAYERKVDEKVAETVGAIRRDIDEFWVRLPVDADGVPWHLGDVTENGNVIEAMGFNKHGWYFTGIPNDIAPSIHRHYKPPTVEDLLEEMYDALEDARIPNGSEKRTYEEIIAEYAAKLRLAGEDE